jgi:outer membrane protein assembly factor BamB
VESEDEQVKISDLEGEPSALERYVKHVEEWFQRRGRRMRYPLAGLTGALVLLLVLLLRTTLPQLPIPVPVLSPSVNLSAAAVDLPGETLVVSPDGTLFALRQTHTVIWRYREVSGIWGTPQVTQGTIIVNAVDGRVIALAATTGKILWSYHTEAHSASVLQVSRSVVFVRDQETRTGGGSVDGLRLRDGMLLWQQPTFHFGSFVQEARAGVAYVVDAEGRIAAVRTGDGSPLWTRNMHMRSWVSTVNRVVYVVTKNGDIAALHAYTGDQLWRTHLGTGAVGPPLIGEGSIVVPMANGSMVTLDTATGAVLWHEGAQLLLATSKLVFGLAENGRMLVLRASDGKLLRWYANIDAVVSPEVSGEILALTGGGDLLALRADTAAILWHWQPSAPILAVHPTGSLYVSMRGGGIVELRASNGQVLWDVGAALQR